MESVSFCMKTNLAKRCFLLRTTNSTLLLAILFLIEGVGQEYCCMFLMAPMFFVFHARVPCSNNEDENEALFTGWSLPCKWEFKSFVCNKIPVSISSKSTKNLHLKDRSCSLLNCCSGVDQILFKCLIGLCVTIGQQACWRSSHSGFKVDVPDEVVNVIIMNRILPVTTIDLVLLILSRARLMKFYCSKFESTI